MNAIFRHAAGKFHRRTLTCRSPVLNQIRSWARPPNFRCSFSSTARPARGLQVSPVSAGVLSRLPLSQGVTAEICATRRLVQDSAHGSVSTMATGVRLPTRSGAEFAGQEFPFTNLVLEGGGAKGIAYIGAAKILEDAGIMKNIRRFGGTSAGAITAALLAMGMTSEEMMRTLGGVDLWEILMDGGKWRWPLEFLNYAAYARQLIFHMGANPGNDFLKWFGEVTAKQVEKYGLDEDVTFLDLYSVLGRELCIVAYNVQYAREKYFHVKTTPLMKVTEAVRMSMSIPVAFQPYERGGFLHIDGGLVANYPVYCFDGWWLSLKPEDTFKTKFDGKTEAEVKTLMSPENLRDKRFSPVQDSNGGEKTLGLLLFSEETDPSPHEALLRARLNRLEEHDPTAKMRRPTNSELASSFEKSHAARVEFNQQERERFLSYGKGLFKIEQVFKKSTPENLEENFMKEFSEEDFKPWGWSKAEAFAAYFPQVEGKDPTDEVVMHLADNWLYLEGKTLSLGEKKVETTTEYYGSLMDFMGKNAPFKEEDVQRTVGIDVDYVGTMDFDMAPEDMNFLMDQGAAAAVAFLREYQSDA